MQKRKPFFVKDNFQLKFIFCYVAILTGGILAATCLIYHSLEGIVEEAAFSSHLSLTSSGELFWRTIVQVNLLISGASVLAGLMVITVAHCYLEVFFRSLAQGLERLAKGDFSFRLKIKGRWLGRQLLSDVNSAAARLEENSEEIKGLLGHSLALLRSDRPNALSEIKAIYHKLRRIRCP